MATALIVLAAGKGTRMKSDLPKVLHPLGGAPMFWHAVDAGQALDPQHVVLVTGHGGAAVAEAAEALGLEITRAEQPEQLGTGHAVAQAAPALAGFEGDAVVLYGDTPFITPAKLSKMQEARSRHDVVILGFEAADPGRYGRLIMEGDQLQRIVEFKDATDDERAVTLCNSGVVMTPAPLLFDLCNSLTNDNAAGEYYLTDIVAIARDRGLSATAVTCDEAETLGINSRVELAQAEAVFQARARAAALENGTTLLAPDTVFFSYDTHLGRDVEVEQNVVFAPGVTVETGARIRAFSHLEGAHVSHGAIIGPYARLRPGAEIGNGARVGNFVEVKNATLGEGAKANHLTYLGDATVGDGANIGAGAVTCNYNGVEKFRTEIGERAFIGSDTMLVAPVSVGAEAMTASGSVITKDVPAGGLALGRAEQVTRPGAGRRLFEMYKRAKENKKKRRQNNMCGIIGVLGDHEAAPIMVEALKRLEYRGYDSAGIATVDSARRLGRRRAVGKLVNLSDRLVHEPLAGKSGIGHTRWATHGGPTEVNAHPHKMGRVAAVHNGIIENFQELREDLESRGVTFQTETDSETTVALAEFFLAQGLSPRDAVEQTIARLEGAYALCFLFDGEDDLMIVARKGSPLVIGYGEGEVFVGSDAIALGPLTDRVTYLEEGDWAVLTRDSVEIINARGDRANRPVTTIQIDTAQIDKGGYKHFMAKEIAEQPSVIKHAISAYAAGADLALPSGLDFSQIDRISIVACGTAHLAGAVARYWFEKIARLPVEVDVASEFRYREPPIPPRTLAIFLSQSGETADTLAALRYMRDKAQVLSITNVATSSIAREADLNLQIHAGAEIGVASTKAFTCKLIVLAALALKAAQDRGEMEAADVAAHLAALDRLPGLMNQALERANEIDSAARKLAEAQDVLFLGRGAMYPLALEGALKLKEISYIHAEGYASGELKHGPIALIDKSVPVVVLAPRDALFEKTISNMQEVMARDGKVLLITDAEGARIAGSGTWRTLVMPDVPELFAPILYAVPAQLLAYYTAVAKGTDVDQPRNLAKSVTVE